MKVTRTLASTALTVGLVAGGTALVSAPAQAAPEAGSHNQVRNQQSQNQQSQNQQGQTQQTEDEARDEIIDRAQTWVDQQVPYDMTGYHPDPQGNEYRTDCSGFVSMAWGLDASENTVTLPDFAETIDKEDLKPGDVLMKGGPGSRGRQRARRHLQRVGQRRAHRLLRHRRRRLDRNRGSRDLLPLRPGRRVRALPPERPVTSAHPSAPAASRRTTSVR